MFPGFKNHLINPDFGITDFGTGAVTSTSYVTPRWKLELIGNAVGSARPSANPSTIDQPKWLRAKSAMTLEATTISVTDRMRLFQRVEGVDRFSRQPARTSVVLYGPVGAQVKYGFGTNFRTIETQGETTPVTASFTESVEDPATEYLDFFIEPVSPGVYQIAFAHLDWPDDSATPGSFEIRPRQVERLLLNRYVYVVPVGTNVILGGANQNMALSFPTPMRVTPSVLPNAGTLRFKETLSGNLFDVPSPSYSLFDADKSGARLRVTGTPSTVVPATNQGYLATPGQIIFSADY